MPASLQLDTVVFPLRELVVVDGETHVGGDVVRRSQALCRRVDFRGVEVVPGAVNAVNPGEGVMPDLHAVAGSQLVNRRCFQRVFESAAVAGIIRGEEIRGVVRPADAVKPGKQRGKRSVGAYEIGIRCTGWIDGSCFALTDILVDPCERSRISCRLRR